MKRLIALFLALVICLSLAACGGGDKGKTQPGSSTPPGSSGQQEQQPSNTPDPDTSEPDDGGEDVDVEAVEWPTADYISESMKYIGTGTITHVLLDTVYAGDTETVVYVNGSSLEDVGNYIAKLKENGFAYFDPITVSSQNEPELAFTGFTDDYQFFAWRGQDADGHYLELELLKDTEDDSWTDSDWNKHPYSYNLKIELFDGNKYSKTGQ